MQAICDGIAAAYGATVDFDYDANYPVTVNHPGRDRVRGRRRRGDRRRDRMSTGRCQPLMGGEDFSYMLEARPGAFIFIGNGDTADLHHPAYDFNDEVDPARRELLGEAGRDAPGQLCAAVMACAV